MHVWEAIAMDEDRQLRPPEEGDQAAEDMEVTYEDTRRFAKCSRKEHDADNPVGATSCRRPRASQKLTSAFRGGTCSLQCAPGRGTSSYTSHAC
jgi:hypothetical protein